MDIFEHELSSITKTLVDFRSSKLLSRGPGLETDGSSDSDFSITVQQNQINPVAWFLFSALHEQEKSSTVFA